MKNKFLSFVLVAAVSVLSSGCAVLVVGGAAAGGYAWYSGELKTSEAVTFDKAVTASQAAMKDLGYTSTETKRDAMLAKLTFRGAGDEKVVVTVNKVSGTVSEIRVRVGAFGDKSRSTMIMDKIKSRL